MWSRLMTVRDTSGSSADVGQPAGPRVSVVLPIFNGARYLAACLDSILSQPSADIEVIAVNGGSTEPDVPRILEKYAARDSRLQVIHEGIIGPGLARNGGMERARGQYVWFVDADDLLPPGSFQKVAAKLARSCPDILLIDFEYLYPGGKKRPSLGVELLGKVPDGGCRLVDQPRLLELAMTSWSKVIRLDFLRSKAIKFEPGIHEDIPVTCALLLDAHRICALRDVCYQYRRKRRGSFMASTSKSHLDIFGSYHGVLDDMEKRIANHDGSVTPKVQETLFRRAIFHYTTTLNEGGFGVGPLRVNGMVPRRNYHEFFESMHADFERYRPPGLQYGSGFRDIKFRLIEQDRYLAYCMLEPLNKLRVGLGRSLRRVSGGPRRPAAVVAEGPAAEGTGGDKIIGSVPR
jgi:CDP-glycerol glycerophosphotransferase